eukprot:m.272369 g.272369  ORF g.272369 m.272369 type:complete len:2262 (+) comp17678_c0_seq5:1038-7823(+)
MCGYCLEAMSITMRSHLALLTSALALASTVSAVEVDFTSNPDAHAVGNRTLWGFSLGDSDQPFNAATDSVLRTQIEITPTTSTSPSQWQGIFETGGDGLGVGVGYQRDGLLDLGICNYLIPGEDGFSTMISMPQGWRTDGATRSLVVSVSKGTASRRWRLHLDTLEISRDVPDVGGWIGADSGSTGVGTAISPFCGDFTRGSGTEVNASNVLIDNTLGVKAWASKTYSPDRSPPATTYGAAGKLEAAIGLNYLRFQPHASAYRSLQNINFFDIRPDFSTNYRQRTADSSATLHMVYKFALKNSGAEELLMELGGSTYGTALSYGVGNVLTLHVCTNGAKRTVQVQVPVAKTKASLADSDWVDVTFSHIRTVDGRFRPALNVDGQTVVSSAAPSGTAQDWTGSSVWWFGQNNMTGPDDACGFGPAASRRSIEHAQLATPYGIRMWQGRACDGNCLPPMVTQCSNCRSDQVCVSGACSCPPGTTTSETSQTCVAPPPCSSATLNTCHADATCINAPAAASGFSCVCKAGFRGNGFNCEPTTTAIKACKACASTSFGKPDTDRGTKYDDVCGHTSASPMKGCQVGVPMAQAAAYCSTYGLRVCTLDELKTGETGGTGCGSDAKNVASSTGCTNGIQTWLRTGGGKATCRAFTGTTVADVRCCADTVAEPAMCTKTSCGTCGANIGSNRRTIGPICGGSNVITAGATAQACAGTKKTFSESQAICASAGARLCTLNELVTSLVTIATGCSYDGLMVWTSTPCDTNGTKYWMGVGNQGSRKTTLPVCASPSTIRANNQDTAVRCCADAVPDPQCSAQFGCDSNPCQNGGTCVPGPLTSYVCNCPAGMVGDNCETNTFCDAGKNPCDTATADCSLTMFGSTCTCKPGHVFSAGSITECEDVNECALEPAVCSGANIVCINSPGSFACECEAGYQFENNSVTDCEDIDECAVDPCTNADCSNTVGSYICECQDGFVKQDGSDDECIVPDDCASSPCTNAECVRGPGGRGFSCSCDDGFEASANPQECLDIDECASMPCNGTDSCENTLGSFNCVPDATVPVLTCIDASFDIPFGASSAIVTYTTVKPTATDSVDGNLDSSVVCSLKGSAVETDDITLTAAVTVYQCSVVDPAGNTDECDLTLTAVDMEAPTIGNCDDIDTGSETATATVKLPELSASDFVDGTVSVTCNPSGSQVLDVNTVTTVLCSAIDAASNIGTCTYSVTVNDLSGPQVTCPADIVQATDPDSNTATVADVGIATAVDTEGQPMTGVVCSHSAGSFLLGQTTIVCNATQDGKTGECSYSVTVEDQQGPAVVCGTYDPFPADVDQDRANVALNGVSATDNVEASNEVEISCTATMAQGEPVTLTSSFTGELLVGMHTIDCIGTDASSNTGSCQTMIEVVDQQAPALTCPERITELSGSESAVPVSWKVSVQDNVPDSASFVCTPESGSSFSIADSPTNVNCIATDAAGNTDDCDFSVSVTDTGVPVIACPADKAINLGSGVTSTTLSFESEVTSSDNSGASPTVVCTPGDGATAELGRTEVTCVATDGRGQTSTCSFDVIVTNPDGPVLACPNDVVLSLDSGETSATPSAALPQASAVTDIDESTLSCNVTGTPLLNQGTTVVGCSAKDLNSDKTGSCTYNVVVKDTTPPVFNFCPSSTSNPTEPGESYALINWEGEVLASDDFDGGDVIPSCNAKKGVTEIEMGSFTVICTATDQAGNQASCEFAIRVDDREQPDMTCTSVTVKLGTGNGVVLSDSQWPVSVVDNSGEQIEAECTTARDFEFSSGVTQVACTAEDAAGNNDTCSFDVNVQIDCVPEWGPYGECTACPNPFKTRMLASEQISAEFGGAECAQEDSMTCDDVTCQSIETSMQLSGVDATVFDSASAIEALEEGMADYYAGTGLNVDKDSVTIDGDGIFVNARRRATDATVDVPYSIQTSDTESAKVVEEVNKLQSDPQAKEAFLASMKNTTDSFGLFGSSASVTQNSATLPSSDEEDPKDKSSSSSNVPMIAGIAGGVLVVAAIGVFLVTRSRSNNNSGTTPRMSEDVNAPKIGRRSSIAMANSHKRLSTAASSEQDNRDEEEVDMAIFSNPTYNAASAVAPTGAPLYANDGVDDTDDSYDQVPSTLVKNIYSSYDDPVTPAQPTYDEPAQVEQPTYDEPAEVEQSTYSAVEEDGGYLDVNEEDQVEEAAEEPDAFEGYDEEEEAEDVPEDAGAAEDDGAEAEDNAMGENDEEANSGSEAGSEASAAQEDQALDGNDDDFQESSEEE